MTDVSLDRTYPLMYAVEQKLISRPIADIPARVRAELDRWSGWADLKPGAEIAITAGSRGISNIALILRSLCDELTRRGYRPFIVPAMGSHGGATVAGQLSILESLGITAEAMGVPLRASMDVDEVGRHGSGQPVVIDRFANRADGIIVVGRVKKHTDFRGSVESGLQKMIVIGLGKHHNATYIHSFGSDGLRTLIPAFARVILANSRILFGLAILEDGYDATSDIVMLPRQDIQKEEPKLLRKAVRQMARLPMKHIDLLIIERMGKDISGAGMDTNVIGRYMIRGVADPPRPRCRYIVVLDVTEASHGNTIGVGLADLTTARLVAKMDNASFYMNAATSGFLERTKIPLACPTDQAAIDLALRLLAPTPAPQARVVRIRDTLHLERFWASSAVIDDLRGNPTITVSEEPRPLAFDADGALI